jgi:hypothetical protein
VVSYFAFHNSDARIMAVIVLNQRPTSGNPIVGATPCGCPKIRAGTLNVPTFKRSNVPTFITQGPAPTSEKMAKEIEMKAFV